MNKYYCLLMPVGFINNETIYKKIYVDGATVSNKNMLDYCILVWEL